MEKVKCKAPYGATESNPNAGYNTIKGGEYFVEDDIIDMGYYHVYSLGGIYLEKSKAERFEPIIDIG